MKLRVIHQASRAWTLIELIVVIIVVIAILAVLLPVVDFASPNRRAKSIAQRLNCVNNLRQAGLAYHLWAQDHMDSYPMEVSTNNGGTMELAGAGEIWRTYQVMSNELSTPKILFCPADDGRWPPATNFSIDLKGKISYFVGLDASTNRPQAFLSGDDNLAVAGQPVKSGLIVLFSNSPAAWTTARHHSASNIGLADGSVLLSRNSELVRWLGQTGLATNRLVIP